MQIGLKNKQTDRQLERLREEDIHAAPSVFSSGPCLCMFVRFSLVARDQILGVHTHAHTHTLTADSKAK